MRSLTKATDGQDVGDGGKVFVARWFDQAASNWLFAEEFAEDRVLNSQHQVFAVHTNYGGVLLDSSSPGTQPRRQFVPVGVLEASTTVGIEGNGGAIC